MTEAQLQEHDWDDVRDALEALEEYLEENEPQAKAAIAAVKRTLFALPENE